MFDYFTGPSPEDAIAIIKNDHDTVKALFEMFENTDNKREKKKIAARAIMELKIHAEIEEKLFYPTVRTGVEHDLMNEADEEHHVAKLLIAELDQMDGSEDHWEAKFNVLSENIRHHIKEEEGDMLPQARKLEIDFNALGQQLLAMKEQLKKNGIPASDEEILLSRSKARADSPAKAARLKPRGKMKPVTGRKPMTKVTPTKRVQPRKIAASATRAGKTTVRAKKRRNG